MTKPKPKEDTLKPQVEDTDEIDPLTGERKYSLRSRWRALELYLKQREREPSD